MSVVGYVLKRPYTVVAMLMLICLLGIGAGLRMPVDIFPEINIPVVSVVWTYNGMNAEDIQNRILTLHERQMASLVQVPAAAWVFRPSGPMVAVVDKDNKVSFHKVAIARDNGNVLEIASGISTGDKIALNISNQITSGETVEVHETKEGAVNAPPK